MFEGDVIGEHCVILAENVPAGQGNLRLRQRTEPLQDALCRNQCSWAIEGRLRGDERMKERLRLARVKNAKCDRKLRLNHAATLKSVGQVRHMLAVAGSEQTDTTDECRAPVAVTDECRPVIWPLGEPVSGSAEYAEIEGRAFGAPHEVEWMEMVRRASGVGAEPLKNIILSVHWRERAQKSPNDPKLSDGGAWRGACPTVARTEDAQM